MFNLMATTVKSSSKALSKAVDALSGKDSDDKFGIAGIFGSLPDKGKHSSFWYYSPKFDLEVFVEYLWKQCL